MEYHYQQNLYHYYNYNYNYNYNRSAPPPARDRLPAVRWVKEWIPQEISAAGGKCSLYRWVREDMVQALKEKERARELEVAPKPEPTTEILFLCSYEGCGKTFTDVAALRKHSNIHGERQHVCNYPGCGKKFADSSKLKRHFLIHTGERDFVCPYEGCGKAFSLDFNLRSHMKTHLAENYHICPYPECRKRYTNELKLTGHIKSYHEKCVTTEAVKHTPPTEKPHMTPLKPALTASKPVMTASKTPTSSPFYVGPVTPARPYECPYEGCDKAYIHEYKLKLHLKREHPDHTSEQMESYNKLSAINGSNKRLTTPSPVNTMREGKMKEKNKPNLTTQTAPAKVTGVNQKMSKFGSVPGTGFSGKQMWTGKKMYEEAEEEEDYGEEDTEETEDTEGNGGMNGEVGWGYGRSRNGRDDDTEDED